MKPKKEPKAKKPKKEPKAKTKKVTEKKTLVKNKNIQKVSQIVKINLGIEKPKAKRSKKSEGKEKEKNKQSEYGAGSTMAPIQVPTQSQSQPSFQKAYQEPYVTGTMAVSEPVTELFPNTNISGIASQTASGVQPTPIKVKAKKIDKSKIAKVSSKRMAKIKSFQETTMKNLIKEGFEESENNPRLQSVGGKDIFGGFPSEIPELIEAGVVKKLSQSNVAIKARERRNAIKEGTYVPKARGRQRQSRRLLPPPSFGRSPQSSQQITSKQLQSPETENQSNFEPISYPVLPNPVENRNILAGRQGGEFQSLNTAEVRVTPVVEGTVSLIPPAGQVKKQVQIIEKKITMRVPKKPKQSEAQMSGGAIQQPVSSQPVSSQPESVPTFYPAESL